MPSTRRHLHDGYAIELGAREWNEPRFRKANPEHQLSKPLVCVGMTGTDRDRACNCSIQRCWSRPRQAVSSTPLTRAIINTVRKGASVVIPGMGFFKQVSGAARTGVNPAAGAKLKTAASKALRFTPGSAFKVATNLKAARRKAGKAVDTP